jgi:hypothetical protein
VKRGEIVSELIQEIKRSGDVHDFQIRCVCGGLRNTCNAGWMKDIEDAAKPIMVPMMNGNKIRLNPDAQKKLAAWSALKAMVMEYNQIGNVTTTQNERDVLRTTYLPPNSGWAIWIGHFLRRDWPAYLGSTHFFTTQTQKINTYFL